MRYAIGVVTIVCLSLAQAAQATTLIAADLGELARDARVVVVGRVVALDPRWTTDRRAIETLVTLDVDTYLKGDFGGRVQFLAPGGQIGRMRSIFVGAPEFALDDRIVVFLGASGPSVPYVLGLSQGVFRVVRDGTGWLVTPPSPVLTSRAGAAASAVVRGDPALRAAPLSEFEQRVRALAGVR